MRKHWTADEDQEFLAMWNQGAPLAEIALRFGRSENAVTQRRLITSWPMR
jgi:DNA-binding CsgD family transcriptional regulator